jgi:parallel beta-helix repeat protein
LIGENRNTTIIDGRGQFYVAHIRSTEGAMLSGFTIRNGSYAGIKSYTNSHCLIQGNILENNEMGIQLWYSSFFIIRENMITGCSHSGIFFGDFTYNNTITQNIIRKNDVGCFFCSLITISNRIYNNTFVNNSWGICSNCHEDEPPSNWNQIYHNHFIHNEVQAYEIEDHHNYWDNGYPSGGNCWSDYTGYDLYSGPDQNILGSDGIGDTPYAIPSGDSIDQYPLMGPPGGPNAVDPHRSSVTLTNESIPGLLTCPAGDGSIYRYVKVTCRNITGASLPGIFVEEFRFIPSGCPGAPSCVFTPVDTETNETGDIRFEVETDSSIIGNISIQVKVTGIPLDDIKVLPAKSIDIVSDGTINIADFVIFGQDYGTTHWRSDFNWDGRVSLNDFVMFAQHYGHHG